MKKQNMRDALLKASVVRDGKHVITCAKALDLAETHGVPPGRIGRMCDAASIKIRQCKLGCF